MSESPFLYSNLAAPSEGMISQEIVSIVKRDGKIMKITVRRDFTGDDDYTDSMVSEVIYVL